MYFKSVSSSLLLFAILIFGVVNVACEKTTIVVPDKSEVTFAVDWSSVRASEGENTASIYLYAKSGTQQPIILRGVSSEKTKAEVPAGTYRVIVVNENLEHLKVRNAESYATFEAYLLPDTRPDADKFDSKTGSVATKIPSVECLHLLTSTTSRELIVEGGKPFSFTLRPQTATLYYRLRVRIPTKLDYTEISAVLGGIASKMSLCEAKPLSGDVSSVDIPLTTTLNNVQDTITGRGEVEVLGVDPANRDQWSNTLYLHLVPKEENEEVKTNFTIDLTDYLNKYSSQNLDIDIKVDTSDPTDLTDVEFEITVKPWIIEDGGHVDMQPNEKKNYSIGRSAKI